MIKIFKFYISGKQNNINVYQIFKEEGNMSKILPQYLCAWTTKKVKDEGVTIIPKTNVEDAELKPDKDGINKVVLHLSNGKKIYVDHVIVSVGVEPNTDLAKTSDLEVDPDLGGFLVNTEMEARSNLYVVSFFFNSLFRFLLFLLIFLTFLGW